VEKATEVLIVGGGIMGCSLAYNLAKRGMSVVVVERREHCGMEASGRNSSGVRAQLRDPLELPLAMASQDLWLHLSEELGYEVEYVRTGNLALAFTPEQLGDFRTRVAREQASGLDVRMVDVKEIRELVPLLSEDVEINGNHLLGGSYCTRDGTANPILATLGFCFAARRVGARIYTKTEVTGFEIAGNRIRKVRTNRGVIEAGIVVNAAGPWAPEVGRMAGVEIPIVPYLCQVFITQKMPKETLKPFTSVMPFGCWTQTYHGNLLFTNEHLPLQQFPKKEVGYDALEYLCYLTATFFARGTLGKIPLLRSYSGWNEVTPDEVAIIGFASRPENLFISAGYSGHGFCLGPISGQICADLITEGKTSCPIADLGFDRFEKQGRKRRCA
jgi:sarcosine oxidase subunit beta